MDSNGNTPIKMAINAAYDNTALRMIPKLSVSLF